MLIVLGALLLPAGAAAQQAASEADASETPPTSRPELARIKQLPGRSHVAGGLVRSIWSHPSFVASSRLARARAKPEKAVVEPKE